MIQNSTVTLDDNGNVINANSIGFDTTPVTPPTTVGTMSWDDGDGVPTVLLKGGNTTLQVGTQAYARVYNDSGTTLTIGQVVYISGAQGNRVAVKLARADVEATSFGTIGVVSETIANGAEGFIIVSGALYKLNTNGLIAGATVYLSPTTAGAVTTTKPQAPNQMVVIGWVERVSTTVGSIYVKIDNGYELDELHDVQIISPVSGNTLIYDAVAGVWENASLTAGTGVSVTNGAGSITLANTGVLSVSGGTTGLTPNTATTGAVTLGGTLAIANGGSGQTTAQTAMNAFAGAVTNGSYLRGNGTNVVMSTIQAGDVPTLNQNTTGSAATLATARTIQTDLASTTAASFNGSADITPGVTGTLPVGNGGLGLSTIAARSIPVANTANTYTTVTPAAGQSIRVNAGNTAWEAFTPGTGTVTSVGGTGTVAGISLSGTVTSSGNLTLGGTFALPTGQVTTRMIYDQFTATAGQTTFTTSQTYTSGKIQVFANGVLMVNGTNVTVTSGTSVVFATGLGAGTNVTLVYPT